MDVPPSTESEKILLFGGTSETALITGKLVALGWEVIVSTATDYPLTMNTHPNITHRSGRLDRAGMKQYIENALPTAIVDATHPYASEVSRTIRLVAQELDLPCFVYLRPPAISPSEGVVFAKDHVEAAKLAFEPKRPVLLTTGTNNLAPYVHEASTSGVPLHVRTLPNPESIRACREAGIDNRSIISGQGPFSLEDNLALMKRLHIGVIVTKDSGKAGGVLEKIEAARHRRCQVVVIQRPPYPTDHLYETIEDLTQAVQRGGRP